MTPTMRQDIDGIKFPPEIIFSGTIAVDSCTSNDIPLEIKRIMPPFYNIGTRSTFSSTNTIRPQTPRLHMLGGPTDLVGKLCNPVQRAGSCEGRIAVIAIWRSHKPLDGDSWISIQGTTARRNTNDTCIWREHVRKEAESRSTGINNVATDQAGIHQILAWMHHCSGHHTKQTKKVE